MAESGFLLEIMKQAKDPNSDSLTAITHLHKEIHAGNAYKVVFTSSATTDGKILYMQINGSSSVDGHLKSFIAYTSEGFADIKLIECSTSSTHTTGSAAITAYNKNRKSTSVSNLKFFSNPTNVSSTASNNKVIDRFQIGGTAGSSLIPGANQSLTQQDEWVIGNSTYILQLTCATTAVNFYLTGSLIYYEES